MYVILEVFVFYSLLQTQRGGTKQLCISLKRVSMCGCKFWEVNFMYTENHTFMEKL